MRGRNLLCALWALLLLGCVIILPAAVRAADDAPAPAAEEAEQAQPPAPLAAPYLYSGKLAEGDAALTAHLQENPRDDEARFGLAVIQLAEAVESIARDLHRYGARPNRLRGAMPMFLPMSDEMQEETIPPDQVAVSYQDLRATAERALADLAKVDKTLAEIRDPEVKLRLQLSAVRLDVFGRGRPRTLVELTGGLSEPNADNLLIAFDRGDVEWLRGYCDALSAWCEIFLAVDGQNMFDRCGHLFFAKVDSPYRFLQENEPGLRPGEFIDMRQVLDAIAGIHAMSFPIRDEKRMNAALEHFEGMVEHARAMWKFYMAETDNDDEWIPNPAQRSAIGVPVTQEIVDTWLKVIDEVDLVLKGERLLPFWRGNQPQRGVNLRRVFTEPQTIDLVYWLQGTAAAPYLEEGRITELAAPDFLQQINQTFGSFRFFGFMFWFN